MNESISRIATENALGSMAKIWSIGRTGLVHIAKRDLSNPTLYSNIARVEDGVDALSRMLSKYPNDVKRVAIKNNIGLFG